MKQRLRRNSDKQRLRVVIVLVIGIIALGFIMPRLFSLAGMAVLYPVQVTQQWFQSTSLIVPALWRDKLNLQKEVEGLRSELLRETDSTVSLQRLREENEQLRRLLSATTSQRIAATVIARPDQLPYDVLQIDQGTAAGITVGAPVYLNDEEVIGLVSEVYPNTALVTLVTTPGFSTTAYVGQSDVFALVEGLGGGVARVSVPQGIPLRVGSLVYLPSIQPGVFGRIVSIENEPTQPQQYGYVVHAVPLQHMRFVSVGQVTDIITDETRLADYISELQTALDLPAVELATTSATTSAVATSSVETPS